MNLLLVGFEPDALDWIELLDAGNCRIAHSANCDLAIDELLRPGAEHERVIVRALPNQLEGTAAFVATVRTMGTPVPIDIITLGTDLASEPRSERLPHTFATNRAESRRPFSGRNEIVIEYHAPCRPRH